ncbi:MAG: hypothetical protein HQ530_00180 [Parcubacteria group bacterium]|nr:hypothetical protein [Parcubacteria group bacterium]
MKTQGGGLMKVGTDLQRIMVTKKGGGTVAYENIQVEGFSAGPDSEETILGEPVKGSRLIGTLTLTGERFVSEPIEDPSPWLKRSYAKECGG